MDLNFHNDEAPSMDRPMSKYSRFAEWAMRNKGIFGSSLAAIWFFGSWAVNGIEPTIAVLKAILFIIVACGSIYIVGALIFIAYFMVSQKLLVRKFNTLFYDTPAANK